MKKIKLILNITGIFLLGFLTLKIYNYFNNNDTGNAGYEKGRKGKFEAVNNESDEPNDNPGVYSEYFRLIKTRSGETKPGYLPGYEILEYRKAKNSISRVPLRTEAYLFTERGPANVPGRTRGIAILPGDPSLNTWVAGSVGGGIWKTSDGGLNWDNKTPDLPNLATTTLAFSPSNPSIIYAGTGESFGSGGLIEVVGQGLYKSTNAGDTWSLIPSTIGTFNFLAINRIIVDPDNPDILLLSANQNSERGLGFQSGIFKSTDGGQNWEKVYDPHGWITQVIYEPGNFNIQYASEYATGVAKSTDAGETWEIVSNGIFPEGRIELAISNINHQRLFAAAEGGLSGTQSDLYLSDDGGVNWQLVVEIKNGNNRNFFAASDNSDAQGSWDNTLSVNPFNNNIVYVGGVDLWKMEIKAGDVIGPRKFAGVSEEGTSAFMSFVNFSAGEYWGDRLAIGSIDTSRFVSIELRFGPGMEQKAHRFETPLNGGSAGDGGAGIPDSLYQYKDYVNVPFEAWDILNNRQLMISFRDQGKNGVFDLIPDKIEGPYDQQSREYFYIHDIDYDPVNPSSMISQDGGQIREMMYFLWPYLASGATWNPSGLPDSKLVIRWENMVKLQRKTTRMTSWVEDGQEMEDGRILPYIHADQHNIIPVITSVNSQQFKLISTNDGGVFQSVAGTDPGLGETDWQFAGKGFNTSQFYGADKKPGSDEYVGGLQDNGSFITPGGTNASGTTEYVRAGGGDGFETVWNYDNGMEVVASSYYNNFFKTNDGGLSWVNATNGLTDIGNNAPFISRLANSKSNPEVLFTVGKNGVWKSNNFGNSWRGIPITGGWDLSLSLNIKVSVSNYNIVWAGGEMSGSGNIFVSTNGGELFKPVNNFTEVPLGHISGIATHPYQDSTAYILFSFAGAPKILRTKDLGQNWEDISGFGTQHVSNNGFPDVAVHCLLVLPSDPDIIWAGTEIGIFESLDDGNSWSILNSSFPSVSVWDMKTADDQVVIATHGRGIWTATIPEIPQIILSPVVRGIGVSVEGDLVVNAGLRSPYDSVIVLLNENHALSIPGTSPGDTVINISYDGPEGPVEISLIAYRDAHSYISMKGAGRYFIPNAVADRYVTDFSENFAVNDFTGTGFEIKSMGEFNPAIHSTHNYEADTNYIFNLKTPVRIGNEIPTIEFDDIAIVEPGDPGSVFGDENFWDYVVVEGSKDGVNWIPLAPGYDARSSGVWLDAFTNNKNGSIQMFKSEKMNFLDSFEAGDIIFIRYRLFSDPLQVGWGWAIDNLYVQEEKPVGLEDSQISLPRAMAYPNPFSQSVQIEFYLSRAGHTMLEIVDMAGKRVASLPQGYLTRGKHEIEWDASTLYPGSYIARVYNNGRYENIKMIKK